MRFVLDTNVLTAAARSRNGASHALLASLPHSDFQPAVSVALFVEYRAILLRPENLAGRNPAQVDGFLDYLLSIASLQEIYFLWRPVLPDPNDDMVLELAVAARCEYIVTYNRRDFRGCERWGISAITPAELLRRMRNRT